MALQRSEDGFVRLAEQDARVQQSSDRSWPMAMPASCFRFEPIVDLS